MSIIVKRQEFEILPPDVPASRDMLVGIDEIALELGLLLKDVLALNPERHVLRFSQLSEVI